MRRVSAPMQGEPDRPRCGAAPHEGCTGAIPFFKVLTAIELAIQRQPRSIHPPAGCGLCCPVSPATQGGDPRV
eukprot:11790830-Alexandrium_andersonii.AAC.1